MEPTYEDFITRAQNSVNSVYAKQILAKIAEENTDHTEIFRLANIDFQEVLQIPSWCRSAILLLCILLCIHWIKDVLKNSAIFAAIRQVLLMLIVLTVLIPIHTVLQSTHTYIQDLSLFLGVLTPTVGILTASGGNVAFAGTISTVFTVFLSVVQIVVNKIIPYATSVFFGFAMIDVLSGERRMQPISKYLRNTLFLIFSLFTTVFFILVSTQSIAAVNTDSVSARTLRLLVSNAVPIVGGAIGDSLKLVGGGLVSVKNTLGTASVVFLVALYLPAILVALGNGLLLDLLGILCEYFELSEVQAPISHIKCAVDFSVATFTFIFVVSVINIGIFMSILPAVIT